MLEIVPPDQQLAYLNLLVRNAPLETILTCIAEIAEKRAPGTSCLIRVNEPTGSACLTAGQHGWHQPIRSGIGQEVGSIRLCQPDGSPMDEPRELLETLARLAGLAYDRFQLPLEVIERSRLAALAVRISGILSRTLPLRAMLQQCTEALVQDLDMAFARIWLLDDTGRLLVLAASAGLSTNLHGAYSRVPVTTSLKIGRMVLDRQPLLTNHILRESWIREPDWAKREGLVAYAGYPLIAEDRVVGVIAMFARQPLPAHTLEALAVMAGGVAQAIVKSAADEQRHTTLRHLGDRVKELQALHETASLLQLHDGIPELLQGVVALLPAAWRYPDITAARIEFAGRDYRTPGFRATPWHQAAEFRLTDGQCGRLEVVYLEQRPVEAEGPFLIEERRLIDSIAEMLRNDLERMHAEQALRESRDLLRRLNGTLEEQVKERTAQLLAKQDQLRSLAVKLCRTEERERRQLATDLHDHLAQLLVIARMKVQAEQQTVEPNGALDDIKGLLDEALICTRTVMSDLRPPLLSDAHDLHRAVSWVVERVRRRGLHVIVHHDDAPVALDEEVLTVTYQAIHELLFNVLKHAQTKEATLTLRRGAQSLEAVVSDRGPGFDMRGHRTASKEGGFGLLNIRERIELLGGRLEISSRIGEGTCSTVIMPLKADLSPTHPAAHSGSPADDTAGPFEFPVEAAGAVTRILLVDDHRMVREGLRSIIEEHGTLRVVAEASDGQMAIQAARQVRPDVILMDVNMPKMNGLEATRLISAEFPEMRIIGLSMHDDANLAFAMRKAGAADYVSKGEAAEKLVGAIGHVLHSG